MLLSPRLERSNSVRASLLLVGLAFFLISTHASFGQTTISLERR
jgi:hypothetical protein